MDDACPLPVWGGGRIVGWAKVDRADWERLRRYRWWLADGYVLRSAMVDGRKTTQSLHREIMGLGPDDPREVDHGDRDRLNNTRSNLTVCTRFENEQNKPRSELQSSRYRGVTLDQRTGQWKAQASFEGRYVYLGVHPTEEAAGAARARFDDAHRATGKLERRDP